MTADDFLLALCLWREARGTSAPARAGIIAVIRNRMNDPRGIWPKDMWACILQPQQFSSFNNGDPNATLWPSQKLSAGWKAWQDILSEIETPLQADPTSGANHYLSGEVQPSWADPSKLTTTIGPFRFYRL